MYRFGLEDVLNVSRNQSIAEWKTIRSTTEISALEHVLAQLMSGKPYQYCVGFTYFDDLKIVVSPAVLIPRPETEELVEWIASSLPKHFDGTIVDWCTGSGCIALALKNRFPASHVVGIDISEEALAIARQNAFDLKLDVSFVHDNALQPNCFIQANIVVSNPPYIAEQEKSEIRTNVLQHEPHLALFVSNENPLAFYKSIAEWSKQQLINDGYLYFEMNENLALETQESVQNSGFLTTDIRQDIHGKNRMMKASFV